MNDATELFLARVPDPDLPALELIIQYQGAIFGGFIRDLLTNTEPNDIDVMLFDSQVFEFVQELTALGYRSEGNKFSKPGAHSLDVNSIPLISPFTQLCPGIEPDADVNLLLFRKGELTTWSRIPLAQIFSHLQSREAQVFTDSDPARVHKLQRTGYRILYESSES